MFRSVYNAVRSETYLSSLSWWLIDEIAWQKLKYSHGMQIEATRRGAARRGATRSITCRLVGSTRACTPICRYPVNRRIYLTRGNSRIVPLFRKWWKESNINRFIQQCTANVDRRCRLLKADGGRGNIFINLRDRMVDRRIYMAQRKESNINPVNCYWMDLFNRRSQSAVYRREGIFFINLQIERSTGEYNYLAQENGEMAKRIKCQTLIVKWICSTGSTNRCSLKVQFVKDREDIFINLRTVKGAWGCHDRTLLPSKYLQRQTTN